MPKIEFTNSNSIAKVLGLKIIFYNRNNLYKVFGYDFTEEHFLKPNQTFEQAVQNWVSDWVRNNFEGIELPERIKIDDIYDEQRIFHNACLDYLLELNPNCVRIEE